MLIETHLSLSNHGNAFFTIFIRRRLNLVTFFKVLNPICILISLNPIMLS